jgi:hypothetical protein
MVGVCGNTVSGKLGLWVPSIVCCWLLLKDDVDGDACLGILGLIQLELLVGSLKKDFVWTMPRLRSQSEDDIPLHVGTIAQPLQSI